MRPERGDHARLYDMLQAAEDVVRFIGAKTIAHYSIDDLLRAAVERKVEIIGEAARNVSQSCRDANPQVPWIAITKTRHVLAHDYDRTNHNTMWRIATVYVPELIQLLRPLIPPIPPDPDPD